jgi:hypothetical protein
MHDARAVCDTAGIRFAGFEADGMPCWVVATLIPDPDSGSASIPGGYIKAETGEFVVPEGVGAVVLKKGRWQVVSQANPTEPTTGSYSWSEPLDQDKRVLTPEDYYSPFAFGGKVVFRPQLDASKPVAESLEQLEPVHLLFPEWSELVQPTFEQLRVGDDRLDRTHIEDKDADRFRQLVSHENGLIGVIAFRRLIKAKRITTEDASNYLKTSNEGRLSAFTYVMAAMSPREMIREFMNVAAARVRTAPQLGETQAIALGAFAAALFDANESVVVAEARGVLVAARERLQVMPTRSSSQLQLMFKQMGINN